MTIKYEGEIKYLDGKVIMPTNTTIPPKQEWNKHAIFQFNGKCYNALTQRAIDNVSDIVKQIEATGKTKATKPFKRKPTSIKYAIMTTGVEPFEYI